MLIPGLKEFIHVPAAETSVQERQLGSLGTVSPTRRVLAKIEADSAELENASTNNHLNLSSLQLRLEIFVYDSQMLNRRRHYSILAGIAILAWPAPDSRSRLPCTLSAISTKASYPACSLVGSQIFATKTKRTSSLQGKDGTRLHMTVCAFWK